MKPSLDIPRNLYFYDCGEPYPYLTERYRVETEYLPLDLQLVRNRPTPNKLEEFLNRQKGSDTQKQESNEAKTKNLDNGKGDTDKETTEIVVKLNEGKLSDTEISSWNEEKKKSATVHWNVVYQKEREVPDLAKNQKKKKKKKPPKPIKVPGSGSTKKKDSKTEYLIARNKQKNVDHLKAVKSKNKPEEIFNREESVSDVEEDDGKFHYEESKVIAIGVISQLGIFLDIISDINNYHRTPPIHPTSIKLEGYTSTITNNKSESDENVVWRFKHQVSPSTHFQSPAVKRESGEVFVPSEFIIELLSISYADLVRDVQYHYREWQTDAHKNICSPVLKTYDSGVSSKPTSPVMSSLHVKPKEPVTKKHPRTKKLAVEVSSMIANIQHKVSSDSGVTSDADSSKSPVKVELQSTSRHVPKLESKTSLKLPKSRLDKYNPFYGPVKNAETNVLKQASSVTGHQNSKKRNSISAAVDLFKRKPEMEVIHEVPNPPTNQAMISFAVSSRACHEKGWVVQPSFLQDPEHATLLLWARKRLQESLRKRENEESERPKVNIAYRYYGDTKRNIAMKYKRGTSTVLKQKKVERPEDDPLFMVTHQDGSFLVFYPSESIAVSAVSSPRHDGFYVLVYSNNNVCENHATDQDSTSVSDNNIDIPKPPAKVIESKLLAYFTPSGRGACYHSNDKPSFVSLTKFGCCLNERGGLIDKWRWTRHKMVPPLSFQVNEEISFRCANKKCMFLVVNIKGESIKINIGSKTEAPEPRLSEMGPLLTMEKFSSKIAIQLSRVKRKEEKRKGKSKEKKLKSGGSESVENISDEVLEQRMKDLDIQFPAEENEVDLITPYQMELKKLQRKFQTVASNWLEHYRKATGMTLPLKLRNTTRQKSATTPAWALPSTIHSSLPDKIHKKQRTPSAPPLSDTQRLARSGPTQSRSSSARGFSDRQFHAYASQLDGRSPSPEILSTLQSMHSSTQPFKCGLYKNKSTTIVPRGQGCPVALRMQLLGDLEARCRCDARIVPVLTDMELDCFLDALPKTQLVVVSLIDKSSSDNPADKIVEKLHLQLCKTRSIPCLQARHDPYRFFRYVIQSSSSSSSSSESFSLLKERHNVVPGTFMMYQGGRLLFADYIFDGYGNTKKDFLRQISKTRKEALQGRYLPSDFCFNASAKHATNSDAEILDDLPIASHLPSHIKIPYYRDRIASSGIQRDPNKPVNELLNDILYER